ncbi:hypothetical protein FAZ15_06920 [Sphingobacterium olei]|uniref:Lipocalin-like domain-containing protein n=1 Tax=Sphingobacterium olei TaxID=2571155 RepID=A0A4U0P4T1_9SPHI|nr:hypothetical protein [Sphingobacterium olei]TJZ62230.1 hypothetical protein FAZ15_06920 [Sphingobacterium olei]
MKTRITLILFMAVSIIGLSSCSKETIDSITRDTALNIITAGVWQKATKTISGNSDNTLNITTELLAEDQTLNFDKDGKAWIKTEGSDVQTSKNYNLSSPKKMTFDGMDYDIKENIVQSIATLTLINITASVRTEIVFKRKR